MNSELGTPMNLPLTTLLLLLTIPSTALPALAGFGRDNVIDVYPYVRPRYTPPPLRRSKPVETIEGTIEATVTKVIDGDTIEATTFFQDDITVRLACIDAPGLSQEPWGQQAKEALAKILPVGQAVSLRIADTDRYDRKVAEIYSEHYFAADLPTTNEIVNLLMVYFGQAVVYNKYLDNCPETRDRYQQAERFARHARLGFWNQASPVMPWDWRAR